MIEIKCTEKDINVKTGEISKIFSPEQLPLIFEVKSAISKDTIWTFKLDDNMWGSYPNNEIWDVVVKDSLDNFITRYYWDVFVHGNFFHRSLWTYCKNILNSGRKPKGIAIGTHDGAWGEWVPVAKNFMSEILLIEASQQQFDKLSKNYAGKDGIYLKNDLITPNGGEVEFFEGGKGYTNSVVEKVTRSWEIEQIHSTKRPSTSINEVLESFGDIDWLHMDVEGLDAKLIMAVKGKLPRFIMFEDNNLNDEEKREIYDYLRNRGYQIYSDGGECMALKK